MTEKWFRWNDSEHPAPRDRDFYVQLSNGYATRARVTHGGQLLTDLRRPHLDEEVLVPVAWRELPKPFKAPRSANRDKYTPEFEYVWTTYPGPPNASKWDAFRAYRNCTVEQQSLIASIMPAVAASMQATEVRYRPHLSTWINGKRFETFRAAKPTGSAAAPSMTEADWRGVLRRYQITQNWNVMEYGPSPGRPGCRVPQNLLQNL